MLKTCTWILKNDERMLISSTLSMKLTKMELTILMIFLEGPRKPMSHVAITERIEKNPDTYKGICMCISRLNKKFKKLTRGDRLFISIRNKGFYLTQVILPCGENISLQNKI